MHLHINRGKKSITLNMKSPDGKQVFEDLVRSADVVIEAMRPGFLDKMGFGFDRLKELKSNIVFCSISGYGATGPYRDLPSHGVAYDSWSGVIAPVTDDEGFARIPKQTNIGITAGPAFGAMAIMAALVRARTTGEPASMEIAQSDSAAYFDWYRIESYKAHERPQSEVTGNASDNYERREPGLGGMWEGVRYQFYESADGYILFMASEQSFWKNFCAGVDRMDLFEKWPGSTYADHARGNKVLQAELRDIFRTRTSAEWIAFADTHNTTIAPVNTPQTVMQDAQFQHRFTWAGTDTTRMRAVVDAAPRGRRRVAGAVESTRSRRAHGRRDVDRARLQRQTRSRTCATQARSADSLISERSLLTLRLRQNINGELLN